MPRSSLPRDLAMSYGGWTALHGLSFKLRRGHVMGFLGPNGAGKTTSIRILTTILRPTSGRFTVDGIGSDTPPGSGRGSACFPETLGLPNQITGIEYITYFARLYGWKGAEARQPRPGAARSGGLCGIGRAADPHLQPRDAAATRHRSRPGQRPGRPLPGRAHAGSGSARAAGAPVAAEGDRPRARCRHHPLQPLRCPRSKACATTS